MPIYILNDLPKFPDPSEADPSGIIAIGGDLSEERLLEAYRNGIFPWYSEGEPITWWCPDPRFVLYPDKLHISKSMRRVLNQDRFYVNYDTAFEQVIEHCQQTPRRGQDGTWITEEMKEAYIQLHRSGYAHSVEVYQQKKLVGGMYGVSLGKCFFGESMFSHVSNASKYALIKLMYRLKEQGFHFLDCQVYTEHLERMGAEEIPRERFLKELSDAG